jgi:hypothetical protein
MVPLQVQPRRTLWLLAIPSPQVQKSSVTSPPSAIAMSRQRAFCSRDDNRCHPAMS